MDFGDAAGRDVLHPGGAQEAGDNVYKLRYGVSAPDAEKVAELEAAQEETEPEEVEAEESAQEESGPDISVSDAQAKESDATLQFRVTLSEAASGPVTVRYATSDGTAVAGEDYTSASGTLTFAAGETEKTIEISLIDDEVEDSGETLTLTLSEAVGGSLEDASATGTILNTEDPQTVSEGDDDLPATTATTGSVVVGESATGEIGTDGDRDWFAVTLEADTAYRFDLKGRALSGGTLYDPHLRGIYDSNGNEISGTTDANSGLGLNSLVKFTATEAGVYYVSVGAGEYGSGVGTYTLSVEEADIAAGTDTKRTVMVGSSSRGDIEITGDRDWFAVTLEAGKTYRFDLKGSSTADGTLDNPYLRGIYDAAGALIESTSNNDGGYSYNSRVTFTATANATYFVSAGANGDGLGSYTLSVEDITDDFTDDTGTTGAVVVGAAAAGEIEVPGDRDWFAVTLEAGKNYRFDLKGWPTRDGSLSDPHLYGIYDSEGNRISGTTDGNSGFGWNSLVKFTAAESGVYYVSAGETGDRGGAYTLSVEEFTDDFTAGTDTSGAVSVGGSVTGNLEIVGDRDWFAVTLEADKTYRFDLKGSTTADGTLDDPYLRGIYDAGGARIEGTSNDNGGYSYNSRVFFTPTENATYYVSAGAGARVEDEGTYTLSVDDITDDFTNDTGATGEVAVGGSARGDIEVVGDRDWFAVTLEAGKRYRFDLEGAETGKGSLSDPYLRGIYDADGHRVDGTANNDGGVGDNSLVFFTPAETAVYYVTAGSFGNEEGTYTLSVRDATDDFTAGTDTTGTVAVGASARGDIEVVGDRDWFAVTLEAGKTYRFDLKGSRTADGTLDNPYLRGIYDAGGALIESTSNNDGGYSYNSRVTFTAAANATYFVSAGANGDELGTYTLSVDDITDDFTDDTGTTGAVVVGAAATGEIEVPGDRDWFKVTLESGKTYQFDLKGPGTGGGTLHDPYLRGIHDSAGNLIAGTTNDDGGSSGRNSQVTFKATEDGAHYVSAGAYSSYTGTYTLSAKEVAEIQDDFTADTGTTGEVAVGGSATGEIEIGGDRDWFAVTLEAGETYRFDLKGSSTGDGTLGDPDLYGIHDSTGALIDGTVDYYDRGAGQNSQVVLTATENATYYVSAGAYRNYTGTYELSVTDIPDDFTADTNTTGAVEVGGSATGEIESEFDFSVDRDWFAVTLEAGKRYRFDLEGSETERGTLTYTWLRGIYDSDGNVIAGTNNYFGGAVYNSRVKFTATENATYYVSASAFGGDDGTYTLSVEEVI